MSSGSIRIYFLESLIYIILPISELSSALCYFSCSPLSAPLLVTKYQKLLSILKIVLLGGTDIQCKTPAKKIKEKIPNPYSS